MQSAVKPTPAVPAPALTVYFDGACPVCSREVAMYRRQTGADQCQWVNAADCSPAVLGADLPREAALGRFHVRLADGRLVQGAPGFAALWQQLPRWRWLGRLAARWPLRPLLALGYSLFLRLRPLWLPAPAVSATAVDHDWPAALWADLRSDQAGEAGAVMIYQAMLALSRDASVRSFAQHHLATEARHLQLIEAWLPPSRHSRLLPAWRVAGWLTGALPALLGPRAVYATVAAVETFVDRHYADQLQLIDRLPPTPELAELRALLAQCQADECAHRDDALAHADGQAAPRWLQPWLWAVASGSAVAVGLARRF